MAEVTVLHRIVMAWTSLPHVVLPGAEPTASTLGRQYRWTAEPPSSTQDISTSKLYTKMQISGRQTVPILGVGYLYRDATTGFIGDREVDLFKHDGITSMD